MHKLNVKLALGLLIALLLVSGCQYDPYADFYTRTRPTEADLVGTYRLTSYTLDKTPIAQLQAQDGSSPSLHSLELRADGTFTAVNLPLWVEQGVDWSVQEFQSGGGTWKIDTVGIMEEDSKIVEFWGLRFYSTDLQTAHTTLVGEKAPYTIAFGYGDPDSGDAMFYERADAVGVRFPTSEAEADELPQPVLLFGVFLVLALIALFIVAGIALGIIILIVIFVVTAILLALGIVSSSVLIGFIQRRPKHGFMAFLVQVGAVLGVPCGVAGLWLLKALTDLQFSLGQTTLYGAFCGLVGGALTGLLFGLALDQVYRWTISRLRRAA